MSLDLKTAKETARVPDLDSPAFADLLAQLSDEFAASAAHYDRHGEFPMPTCAACTNTASSPSPCRVASAAARPAWPRRAG